MVTRSRRMVLTSCPSPIGFNLELRFSRRNFLCLTRAIHPVAVPSRDAPCGQGGRQTALHARIEALFSGSLAIEEELKTAVIHRINQGVFGHMPKMGGAGYKLLVCCGESISALRRIAYNFPRRHYPGLRETGHWLGSTCQRITLQSDKNQTALSLVKLF